jgi:glutamate racemase
VQAIRRRLPNEDVVYFGDTARVPYGSKSAQTVTRFTREICGFLAQMRPKVIIAACNTASAIALPTVRSEWDIPILDVVEPSARRVARLERNGLVAVLGTEATIDSCAFEQRIHALRPDLRVIQQSCPLFVPLVEEGRSPRDPIVEMAIDQYLSPVKRLRPNVVLLACTHYPVLASALADFFGPEVELLDSGESVAASLADLLDTRQWHTRRSNRGVLHCYVSDYPQRFAAIGAGFAGEPLTHVLRAAAEAWTTPDGHGGSWAHGRVSDLSRHEAMTTLVTSDPPTSEPAKSSPAQHGSVE